MSPIDYVYGMNLGMKRMNTYVDTLQYALPTATVLYLPLVAS